MNPSSSSSVWVPSLLSCVLGLRTEALVSVSGGPHVSLQSPWPLNSGRSPHPAKKVNEFGDKYLKCG